LSGTQRALPDAAARAAEAIDRGDAGALLDRWIAYS